MITVTSYVNEDDNIIGFNSSGHANYANKGQDIVCSAVSVLVINTVNSIYEFTSDITKYSEDEEAGIIDFMISSNVSSGSELLLKSLFLGLEGIQDSYGTRYLNLKTKKIR